MEGGTKGANGHKEDSVKLPSATPYNITSNVIIQPPLSRRGHGPALIVVVPSDVDLSSHAKTLDPPPLQKWAEEGYAVAQITLQGDGDFRDELNQAVEALEQLDSCDSNEKLGLICTSILRDKCPRHDLMLC